MRCCVCFFLVLWSIKCGYSVLSDNRFGLGMGMDIGDEE